MTFLTEKARSLAFVLSEADRTLSRDVVTIVSGAGILEAGTVLGKITATGKYTAAPAASTAGIEGAETALAILAYGVDATAADVTGVVIVANHAEVKDPMLIFHSTVNDATKRNAKLTQLRAVGIKAR